MGLRWAGVALIVTTGCQDLAKLETEQAALESEVGVLRDNVETLRREMKRAGLVKAGPANLALSVGQTDPTTELSDQLAVTATRTGTPPSLAAGPLERREKTDCGYRVPLGWLEPISDLALSNSGAGRASPVLATTAGTALAPHAAPAKFEKSCGGAFRHQGKYLFFSPAGNVESADQPELTLDPAVPMLRDDGSTAYWVYPGTTLTLTVPSEWDAAWGELAVDLDARILAVGTQDHQSPGSPEPATVSILGQQATSVGTRLGIHVEPDALPTGPWTIEIASPKGGGYVLIDTLTAGNEENALVVAGGRSGDQ